MFEIDPLGPLLVGDLVANVVAYIPLGAVLAAAIGRRGAMVMAWVFAVFAASLLSAAMEVLQSCLPMRTSSMVDLLANTAGAAAGASLLAWRMTRRRPAARSTSATRGPPGVVVARLSAASIFLGIVIESYPWTPTLDMGQIRANLAFMSHGAGLNVLPPIVSARLATVMRLPLPNEIEGLVLLHDVLGATLLAASVLAWCWGAGRRTWVLPAAAVVGLMPVVQILCADRTLSWEGLAATAVTLALLGAVACWPRLQRLGGRTIVGPLGTLMVLGATLRVVMEDLRAYPGGGLTSFSLWPHLGSGNPIAAVARGIGGAEFPLQCALAVAMVCASRGQLASRVTIWSWGAAVVMLRLGLEIGQQWVPGRTSDTTSPILAVLVWSLVWVFAHVAVNGPSGLTSPAAARARPPGG